MEISQKSLSLIIDSLTCRLYDKKKFLSEVQTWSVSDVKSRMVDSTQVEIDALQVALFEVRGF